MAMPNLIKWTGAVALISLSILALTVVYVLLTESRDDDDSITQDRDWSVAEPCPVGYEWDSRYDDCITLDTHNPKK